MRQRKAPTERRSNALKDATYRAIYRLEAGNQEAASALCNTLQAAWLARASVEHPKSFAQWLDKVLPLSLALLADRNGFRSVAGISNMASGSRFRRVCQKGKNVQVQIKQLEGVRFSVEARSHVVICDQPAENGGADSGMTPPELLLASLGSCAAFYAVQYLKTRNLSDGGVEVSVTAEKLKQPARLGNFQIDVVCPVALSDEQQQGMMNAVHHCPIHNTLLSPPEMKINLTMQSPAARQ